VDDTTIWEGCSISGSDSSIQQAADQLVDWCKANNMTLNVNKTKEMRVYLGKKELSLSKVVIGQNEVESVVQFKLLGLIINDHLTWHDHVSYITKKAAKRLYYLTLLRRTRMPESDMTEVYTATIRSILEYACEVWGPAISNQLSDMVEHIQFRALKIIFPDLSYREALNQANLETLHARRDQLCKKFFVEMTQSNHPLNYLLPKTTNKRILRSQRQYDLPKVRTNRLKHSPIFNGLFKYML
jgi:hypothetical protein